MVNKKAVIISTIVFLIIVALLIFVNVKSLQDEKNQTVEVLSEIEETDNVNNNIDNVIENEIDNSTSEEENAVVNNSVTNSASSTTSVENDEDSSDLEDIAIQLAEDEWGDDENVYYYIEEKLLENVYVVSVRDKSTTATLANYKINVETEEVSDY